MLVPKYKKIATTPQEKPKGDSSGKSTGAKAGPKLNSVPRVASDGLAIKPKASAATRAISVSERIAKLKKIPTSNSNWETERASGLMELTRLPGLSRAEVDTIAAAVAIAGDSGLIRKILCALLPFAQDVAQAIAILKRIPIGSDWEGERAKKQGLLEVIERFQLSRAGVQILAKAAPTVREKAWVREVLKALLPKARDLDQSLDLIRRMPTDGDSWDGEKERFKALMTLTESEPLSPSEITKIAKEAPMVQEKTWIREVLKALLPKARDLDQSLDLIRRMPTDGDSWDGEKERYKALMTLTESEPLSPSEITKIAKEAPVAQEKTWIREVLKALLPKARDLDQSLDLIRRMPTDGDSWDGEKERFTALMALAKRSDLSPSQTEKISQAAPLAKDENWIRQIREQAASHRDRRPPPTG